MTKTPIDIKASKINLNLVDTINVSNIKDLVNSLTGEQWLENTSRQTSFNNHSTTQTYFLADYFLGWEKNTAYESKIVHPESPLWEAVLPVVQMLEEYHDGRVGRVILPKLLAGGIISAHRDSGDYLEAVHRHHIAIVTNENVSFMVDDETINMREGEIWEINNNMIHEVENMSDQDRVHLLIDIIPNKFLA
jgi:quercetin dioxygenase-like cupin family protein